LIPEGVFDHVPAVDVTRARIVDVPWLPLGVDGMTLGRFILMRRGTVGDRTLLAHELVHVRQWRELRAARFLWRYLSAYAAGRARRLDHRQAYLDIPLEVEARTLADRPGGW
jgi:hypothetical protein